MKQKARGLVGLISSPQGPLSPYLDLNDLNWLHQELGKQTPLVVLKFQSLALPLPVFKPVADEKLFPGAL